MRTTLGNFYRNRGIIVLFLIICIVSSVFTDDNVLNRLRRRQNQPTSTNEPTPEPTPQPTSTPEPTPEPTPQPTSTPTSTPTPEPTPLPTASPVPTTKPILTNISTNGTSPTPKPVGGCAIWRTCYNCTMATKGCVWCQGGKRCLSGGAFGTTQCTDWRYGQCSLPGVVPIILVALGIFLICVVGFVMWFMCKDVCCRCCKSNKFIWDRLAEKQELDDLANVRNANVVTGKTTAETRQELHDKYKNMGFDKNIDKEKTQPSPVKSFWRRKN